MISVFGGLGFLSFLGRTLAVWSKLMQRWVLFKLYYPFESLKSLNHSTSVSIPFLVSAHKPKQPGEQISFTRGTLRTHVVSRENFSEDIKIIQFGKANKTWHAFCQPQERDKGLRANLLCKSVLYDKIMCIKNKCIYIVIYIYGHICIVLVIGYVFH